MTRKGAEFDEIETEQYLKGIKEKTPDIFCCEIRTLYKAMDSESIKLNVGEIKDALLVLALERSNKYEHLKTAKGKYRQELLNTIAFTNGEIRSLEYILLELGEVRL